MKTLKIMAITAVLALASTSALADGRGGPEGRGGNGTNANATSETASSSDQLQGQGQSVDSHNVSQASDMGDMVGAAIAPALTTTLTETCMGSTSIGAGWSGGGVSFGTTWRDSACVRRLDAREIKNIHPNFAIVAKEIMCDSEQVYNAFKRAGMPCVVQEDKEPAKAKPSTASTKIPGRNYSEDVSSTGNGLF